MLLLQHRQAVASKHTLLNPPFPNFFMDEKTLRTLLQYAFPCARLKVERGEMTEDEYRMIESYLKKESPLTKPVEEVFPVATAMIRAPTRKSVDEITVEDVRNYFWHRHDEVIARRLREGEKFDAKKCEVRAGKVVAVKGNKAHVQFHDGTREEFDNSIARALKGDHVTVHFNHVCEKISKHSYDAINKKKRMV